MRDRVDFLRRTLVVDAQLTLLPGGRPNLAPPKTRASYRSVPLADVVLEALADHVKVYPTTTARDERGRPGALMFSDENGRPVSRTYFLRRAWGPAVRRVGSPAGTRFHELRHFYASLLIDGGESVKAVQVRLGHATAEETLNTYAHLWPDSEEPTREAVDRGLGRSAMSGDVHEGEAPRHR